MPERVGVLGGAFDPIHWGHVGAAIECAYQLRLDRVLLVPGGDPPWKQPAVNQEDRYRMVQLAAAEHPSLEASRLELDSPGPHYTVDTLRRIRAQLGDATLYLIVGDDAAARMQEWRELDTVLALATLVVVERAGWVAPPSDPVTAPAAERRYDEWARSGPGAGLRVSWPGVAVSSSEIRRRVREGAPIEYLVPRSVADYLKGNLLYV
ncbi:MAG TPA: nicotinate-nucleotide adenylyltransferase [Deinococcales bacterium]|nr:nicotinate-nucleotide adenylyltransferase [Deinococcales bacterium]